MSSPINLPKTTYIQTTAFISYFEIYTDICRNLGSKVILGTFEDSEIFVSPTYQILSQLSTFNTFSKHLH